MGNNVSFRSSGAIAGKVLFPDGTVLELDKPMSVAELMLDYPQQFVVEFESVVSGKRLAPLPADKELEMNKVYFMLPMKRGKLVCSTEEVNRVWTKARSMPKSGRLPCASSRMVHPLLGQKCKDGMRRNEDGEGCFKRSHDWDELVSVTVPFMTRQVSGKAWKPTLDTITEKRVQKKHRYWLF